MAMTEMNAPAVTVTEVVLPGKVEPSGLRLAQRELPPPAAGQALVRVESTAVSFAESAMRRGRYYGQPPFPFVPGYDLVGVVEAVGPGVNRSLTGRRVAALTKTGGWATAVLLSAADLVEVPDGVSADEAETLIVNGVTAYQMLHRTAKVQAGQTVLVLGASGGVGTILVQLARHAGARVIGTASPRHHDALRALGVEPIDYRSPDLAARVRELAPGCSTAPAPWSLTASPASSTTPAPRCPASCGCWRNWRSGTTCPRASTRASTTSGRVKESQAQPSGKRSGPGCAPISRTCSAC
jgi:NADPH2:quinone reductase